MIPPQFAAAALMLTTLSLSTAARADIVSTFDTGLEGWTGLGGTVSHAAGSHLQQLDTQNTWMSVVAPVAFRGDLSAYLGGTLSFDGRNLNGVAANLGSAPWFGRVTITGAAGSAWRDVAGVGPGRPASGAGWLSYAAALDVLAWSGNLAGALVNVTAMKVTATIKAVLGTFSRSVGRVFKTLSLSVPTRLHNVLDVSGRGVVVWSCQPRVAGARPGRRQSARRRLAMKPTTPRPPSKRP